MNLDGGCGTPPPGQLGGPASAAAVWAAAKARAAASQASARWLACTTTPVACDGVPDTFAAPGPWPPAGEGARCRGAFGCVACNAKEVGL